MATISPAKNGAAVRMLLALFLAVAPLAPLAARGAASSELFISPAGNDTTGSGTREAPFATFRRAVNASAVGGTVTALPGTYIGDGNRDIVIPDKGLTIRGEAGRDQTVLDGQSDEGVLAHRGFFIENAGSALTTFDGLGIQDFYPSQGAYHEGEGGGIYCASSRLLVRNCRFLRNKVKSRIFSPGGNGVDGFGGGIRALNSPEVRIEKCEILDNYAIGDANFGLESSAFGGGIALYGSTAMIRECVINQNHNLGVSSLNGTVTIERCCVSLNPEGGVVATSLVSIAPQTVLLRLTDSTLTGNGNSGVACLNGIIQGCTIASNDQGATVDRTSFRNCIVSFNISWNIFGTNNISNGHNLSDQAYAVFTQPTDITGMDPRLGPLQDNGGPTPTMALGAGSPAIDAGNDAFAGSVDQRGQPRRCDGDKNGAARVDIGAYEVQSGACSPSASGILNYLLGRDPYAAYLDVNNDAAVDAADLLGVD